LASFLIAGVILFESTSLFFLLLFPISVVIINDYINYMRITL
jgi:hypothetical protein